LVAEPGLAPEQVLGPGLAPVSVRVLALARVRGLAPALVPGLVWVRS
jgi:hypothetical protein